MPDLDSEENEKKMAQMEAIIYSMTLEERRNPDLLNPSRKHRIAKGEPYGKTVQRIQKDDEETSWNDGWQRWKKGQIQASLLTYK